MHGSVLISPKCEHGLMPDFSNAPTFANEYEKAIFTGRPGTIDKTIHATFAGVLHHEPSDGMFRHGQLIYVLRIESMDHLTLTFKPGQEPLSPPPSSGPKMETHPPNLPPGR
jgi:hypothetical protein